VTGWDPFEDSFRIVERFGGRFREGLPLEGPREDDPGTLVPPADVFEDGEGIIIEIELSGVLAEDVALHTTPDALVVEAQRRFARNGREVRQIETSYGRMRREFSLPPRAQAGRAVAELRRGVLRVHIPRAAQASTETLRVPVKTDDDGQKVPVGSDRNP
jgi:HSP20 family protein